MLKWLSKKRNQKGFTLIELVVVIAILGILAALAIPRFSGFQDKARSSQAIVEAKQVATAAEVLMAEGKIADDVTVLTADHLTALNKLLSPDITLTSANIKDVSVSGKRFMFTYITTVKGKTYTAVRDNNGEFTTSW